MGCADITGKIYETILVEQQDRVGIIRLNRPKALNALNTQLMSELTSVLQGFDAADDIGCIVLTGNDKAFAAGADITDIAPLSALEITEKDPIGTWDKIATVKKPIIAAVQGYALGGGLEISMMCDIIVAGHSAQFGQPEIKIGVIPGAGGTQRLTRLVGKVKAMELILTGQLFSAEEAYEWGVVSVVVGDDVVEEKALKLAHKISRFSLVAVMSAKAQINQALETPLSIGLKSEREAFYQLFDTQDQKEGMAAFVEKRPAEFKHC